MSRIIKNLKITEVSAVMRGANPGAQMILRKADNAPPEGATIERDISRRLGEPKKEAA